MARIAGRKDLRDDEIIRFQRFSVVESGVGTYTEQSFDTQLSIDRGLIWLIHWIEWDISGAGLDEPAQDAIESILCQITRESKTGMANFADTDLITQYSMKWKRAATIGTDAGPMALFDYYPKMQYYNPPLAHAAQSIYVAIQTTNAAATTVKGRIAYTLRRVTDKFFYRVAQALIS